MTNERKTWEVKFFMSLLNNQWLHYIDFLIQNIIKIASVDLFGESGCLKQNI